jgi:hypothetical protein
MASLACSWARIPCHHGDCLSSTQARAFAQLAAAAARSPSRQFSSARTWDSQAPMSLRLTLRSEAARSARSRSARARSRSPVLTRAAASIPSM